MMRKEPSAPNGEAPRKRKKTDEDQDAPRQRQQRQPRKQPRVQGTQQQQQEQDKKDRTLKGILDYFRNFSANKEDVLKKIVGILIDRANAMYLPREDSIAVRILYNSKSVMEQVSVPQADRFLEEYRQFNALQMVGEMLETAPLADPGARDPARKEVVDLINAMKVAFADEVQQVIDLRTETLEQYRQKVKEMHKNTIVNVIRQQLNERKLSEDVVAKVSPLAPEPKTTVLDKDFLLIEQTLMGQSTQSHIIQDIIRQQREIKWTPSDEGGRVTYYLQEDLGSVYLGTVNGGLWLVFSKGDGTTFLVTKDGYEVRLFRDKGGNGFEVYKSTISIETAVVTPSGVEKHRRMYHANVYRDGNTKFFSRLSLEDYPEEVYNYITTAYKDKVQGNTIVYYNEDTGYPEWGSENVGTRILIEPESFADTIGKFTPQYHVERAFIPDETYRPTGVEVATRALSTTVIEGPGVLSGTALGKEVDQEQRMQLLQQQEQQPTVPEIVDKALECAAQEKQLAAMLEQQNAAEQEGEAGEEEEEEPQVRYPAPRKVPKTDYLVAPLPPSQQNGALVVTKDGSFFLTPRNSPSGPSPAQGLSQPVRTPVPDPGSLALQSLISQQASSQE